MLTVAVLRLAFFFFCKFVLCVSAIAGHSCPAMFLVQRQSHVCFCLFALLVIHGEFPNIVLLRALCAALTYILHAASDCVVKCPHLLCLLCLRRFVAEGNPVDYGCFAIIYTTIHIYYIYIYTYTNNSVDKATVLALLALLPAFLLFPELPSRNAAENEFSSPQ